MPEARAGPGRREARERALEILYEADSKRARPAETLAELPVAPDPYAVVLVEGVDAGSSEIDALIERFSEGWSLQRLPVVDKAVLRIAVFELLRQPDVPTAVVLSEAVELAKQYSTKESGSFVNGLLASVAGELRGDGSPSATAP